MIVPSVVTGLIVGILGAVVFLVYITMAQPNFEPASFSFSIPVLGPWLLAVGLALGALTGFVAGAIASRFAAPRVRAAVYAIVFVGAVASASWLLLTHPLGAIDPISVPARLCLLAIGVAAVAISAPTIHRARRQAAS